MTRAPILAVVALAVLGAPEVAAQPLSTPADPPPVETRAPPTDGLDDTAAPDDAALPEAADPDGFSESGDPESTEQFGEFASDEATVPALAIYGFADFGYQQLLVRHDSVWRGLYLSKPSFSAGNLNLYFDAARSSWWRALAEVRFTYLPNGVSLYGADGSANYLDTTVPDYRRTNRNTRWSGILIERATLELVASQYLRVQVGRWLTPYGIWNADHGSPTVVAVDPPYVIAEELIPERQTGLLASGEVYGGRTSVQYVVTLSNGRGPADEYRDLDANKAVGGRLLLRTRLGGDLELGASVYRGRYTSVERQATIAEGPSGRALDVEETPVVEYEEFSYAGDARYRWRGLLVQLELVGNEARFTAGRRPDPWFPQANAVHADYRRLGGYFLVGYRTPWLGVMPYVMGQHINFADREALPPGAGTALGVNVRPVPELVFKGEYLYGVFHGDSSIGIHEPLRAIRFQAAWAF